MTTLTPGLVADVAARFGLAPLPETALVRLADYGNLLIRWNGRMNLTAIREPSAILERHLIESIAAAQVVPAETARLLDYGSGAGLPGIPIAIARPDLRVTLAEAQSKKVAFLREAIRTLELTTDLHPARVSAMPASIRFDCITLRAVDDMKGAIVDARLRLADGGALLLFATEKTKAGLLDAVHPAEFEEVVLPTVGSMLVCRL